MIQIFGHFIEEFQDDNEYLKIGFSPRSVSLKQRWRTNGLSADFIADYLQAFFTGKPKNINEPNAPIPAHSKSAVKYVANELLENAMKFSDDTLGFATKIAFHLYDDKLVFHVTNSIKPEIIKDFQNFINELLQEEPNELYFRRMETNALDDNNHRSGLGVLSMICDYSAQVAWKFETLETSPPITLVTTMVCLEV
ncbi:conserved hypothetical protein [Beggiatoa sp. PS]|nr:conserved hypothetical protein [Beggiatoa sp. PS]